MERVKELTKRRNRRTEIPGVIEEVNKPDGDKSKTASLDNFHEVMDNFPNFREFS